MSSLSDTRPLRIAAIDALRGFDMFFLTGGLLWLWPASIFFTTGAPSGW